MEYPTRAKTKKAKKIAKRKERRRFVKWLVKNQYFHTWFMVQRRHKSPTSFKIYYPEFVGCRFFINGRCILNDEHLPEMRCKCATYYKYPQK